MYAANIFIRKAIPTTRERITKRISGQQKQPGSFILQAEPLSRSYHVAVSICRIYNTRGSHCLWCITGPGYPNLVPQIPEDLN